MHEVYETLAQGGWLMAPIGVCSLLALTVIIERAIALRRNHVIDARVADAVSEYDGHHPPAEVQQIARQGKGAFARIVEETIKARHLGHAQLIETMHATGRTQVGYLQRGLTALEIIAGISPLMGLLGTVLGMVTVFNAITVEGIGNPQVLSAGISQALITTVAGLSVAIPALAAWSWFSRRVEELATEMQERITAFTARLAAHENGGPALDAE